MNFPLRLFFIVLLFITYEAWKTCLRADPDLLSTGNILAVIATCVLAWLWYHDFHTAERQTFWKAMTVILTVGTLVTLVYTLDDGGPTVLLLLILFSLISVIGSLYEERYGDKLTEIRDRFRRNKQKRRERREIKRQREAEAETGLTELLGSQYVRS